MEHTCHARGCEVPVPRRLFMCKPHWSMLTKREQSQLWAVYVSGQERRMDPSEEYLGVAMRLIDLVAERENPPQAVLF